MNAMNPAEARAFAERWLPAWTASPAYQAIVGDGHAGTVSNVVMLDGLRSQPPSA